MTNKNCTWLEKRVTCLQKQTKENGRRQRGDRGTRVVFCCPWWARSEAAELPDSLVWPLHYLCIIKIQFSFFSVNASIPLPTRAAQLRSVGVQREASSILPMVNIHAHTAQRLTHGRPDRPLAGGGDEVSTEREKQSKTFTASPCFHCIPAVLF